MSEPYIGEIRMFAGNFAPRSWAFCDGQLLAITQNDALFSLFGTYYGGDGRTTFGLPDLRGRIPIHYGSGPGLPSYNIGSKSGQETVALTTNTLPSHRHAFRASSGGGAANSPIESFPAGSGSTPLYQPAASNLIAMKTSNPPALQTKGGSQQHNNMMPFQCIHFIVALYGIYPSRS